MEPSVKFWDNIAERYSKKPVADEMAYQRKLQVTREYLRPDMTVLELGCGTGSTALTHAPYVKHIHAIDISSKMLEIAQEKAEATSINNVSFEQLNVAEFSVPDQSQDAVLALSVLHLLENKEETIAKAYQALKPGGILVSSTPCVADTMKFFKFIAPIGYIFGLIPMVQVFTTRELEVTLTDAGFDIDYQWRPRKGAALFVVAKKPSRRGQSHDLGHAARHDDYAIYGAG